MSEKSTFESILDIRTMSKHLGINFKLIPTSDDVLDYNDNLDQSDPFIPDHLSFKTPIKKKNIEDYKNERGTRANTT